MPEGDVVRRTAARLDAALTDRVLLRAELRWPTQAEVDLRGRVVTGTLAYGKHLLTRTDDGRTLHTHLRMEGRWDVARSGTRSATAHGRDVRVVLGNETWTAVGTRLGMLDVLRTADEGHITERLGPDVLGDDFPTVGLGRALELLAQAPEMPVAAALLDQRNVAGLGTIWTAESLAARRRWPWTPVGEVDDLAAVLLEARRLMRLSVDHGPGVPPVRVHGRARQACRSCGTPVVVAPAGTPPLERPIYYCPTCQAGRTQPTG